MQWQEVYRQILALLNEETARGKLLRLGFFLLLFYISGYFVQPMWFHAKDVDSSTHRFLAGIITQISVNVLKLFYANINVSSDFIVSINGKQCIALRPGCNGFNPIMRISLTLAVYPMVFKSKLLMLPLTVLILLIAAILHFMILIPISYYAPNWYVFSHNYLTKTLFFTFYFFCWIIWEKNRSKLR